MFTSNNVCVLHKTELMPSEISFLFYFTSSSAFMISE